LGLLSLEIRFVGVEVVALQRRVEHIGEFLDVGPAGDTGEFPVALFHHSVGRGLVGQQAAIVVSPFALVGDLRTFILVFE
jgi:hypothetical protein